MKALKRTIHSLYQGTKIIDDIQLKKHITCFDIDGTLTGPGNEYTPEVRQRAERLGAVIFSTARTPELCWSSTSYDASLQHGFNRPEPRVPLNELGKRYFKPLELQDEFNGILDPDAVLSMGAGIWIRTGEGYTEDKSFQAKLCEFPDWRTLALELLSYIDEGDVLKYLSKIDHPHMYETRDIDIAPLPHRIQLDLPSLELKIAIIDRIQHVADSYHILSDVARNTVFVDESNPAKGRYTLYLMPFAGPKEKVLDYFLTNCSEVSGVELANISLLITGDTLTDIKAGCFSGPTTQGTFLLVGGSRLAPLFDGSYPPEFAGVDMEWLWNSLQETEREGYYIFQQPGATPRIFIVGDIAYPGTKDAETILAYMDEHGL